MESIGETLRQARHTKKGTLDDAARATKIKVDILERLESDEFSALAAPAYAKGFLKLYADYLGLDSAAITEAYVRSQGGLRRQGLQIETETAARSRNLRELQLPVRQVLLAVATVTLITLALWLGKRWWSHRRIASPLATTALPKANFEPYYPPKHKPVPEVLESPTK